MKSIELYKSLIRKALNGSLTKNEAIALKSLDVLIESDDKMDEGVFDLKNYQDYFGPMVSALVNSAEPDNKVMADSLASFNGFSETFMSEQFIERFGQDPLEALGGFEAKSKLMDNINTDNPLEKAIGYNDAVGYVPEDIMKDAQDAIQPLTTLVDTQQEVEKHLNNIPAKPDPGFTEDEWITLKGWNDFENVDQNATVDVMVKWISSLGIPILGGAVGGLPGALGGAAVAPDFPIAETIELFDPGTQDLIYASMPAWLMPFIKKVSPQSDIDKVVEKAIEGAKEQGVVDLDKIDLEKTAGEIKDESKLGKAGKAVTERTLNFLNKYKGLGPIKKAVIAVGGLSIVGAGAYQLITGPTEEQQNRAEGIASIDPTTTTIPTGGVDTSSPGGITEAEETEDPEKEIKKFFNQGIADNLWLDSGDLFGVDEMFRVPEERAILPGDPEAPLFRGLKFSGEGYFQPPEGNQGYIGPSFPGEDTSYLDPMIVRPGARINKNVFQKVIWNGMEMSLLEVIGITAKNYGLDPGIIYGLIEKETGGTFDPSIVAKDDGGPGWDSIGLGQINMNPNSFGEGGPVNTAGEIPGDLEFVTPEQAADPVFAVNFIGNALSRYQKLFGGGRLGLISALAAYNGGYDAGKVVFDSNGTKVKVGAQKQYIRDILQNAQAPGISDEFYSKSMNDVSGMGTKREWDEFSPTGTEAIHAFIDDFVGTYLDGVKATQEDYDTWRPRFLEAERAIYTEDQKLKDKGQRYKGLSVDEKLFNQLEEDPEYQFVDQKKKHQKVQDWATDNLLGAFDI